MSGWQKIGAVISVLWLIGLPTYFVVHSSMNADHLYDECMKSVADLTREEQHETCWSSSHLGAVTPKDNWACFNCRSLRHGCFMDYDVRASCAPLVNWGHYA